MLKKVCAVLVPLAALAALMVALSPAAASADTYYKCPPGVTDHHYCTKYKKCHVPDLIGKTVKQAKQDLKKHDCRLGKVHYKPEKSHKGKGHHGKKHSVFADRSKNHKKKKKHHGPPRVGKNRIYKQRPKAGKVFKKGHKVNVWVNGKKPKHHHHHHHKKK